MLGASEALMQGGRAGRGDPAHLIHCSLSRCSKNRLLSSHSSSTSLALGIATAADVKKGRAATLPSLDLNSDEPWALVRLCGGSLLRNWTNVPCSATTGTEVNFASRKTLSHPLAAFAVPRSLGMSRPHGPGFSDITQLIQSRSIYPGTPLCAVNAG